MLDSIIIGGVGGFIAGVSVYLSKQLVDWVQFRCDEKKVHEWLIQVTDEKEDFKNTKEIASWCNLTIERVKYICSNSEKFVMDPKYNHRWSIDNSK